MGKFIIIYYNRYVNQVQYFRVEAKSKYRAGRLFYKHKGIGFKNSIQMIIDINEYAYWTEERIKEDLVKN